MTAVGLSNKALKAQERRREVSRLYGDGWPPLLIARRLGIKRRWVYELVKRLRCRRPRNAPLMTLRDVAGCWKKRPHRLHLRLERAGITPALNSLGYCLYLRSDIARLFQPPACRHCGAPVPGNRQAYCNDECYRVRRAYYYWTPQRKAKHEIAARRWKAAHPDRMRQLRHVSQERRAIMKGGEADGAEVLRRPTDRLVGAALAP